MMSRTSSLSPYLIVSLPFVGDLEKDDHIAIGVSLGLTAFILLFLGFFICRARNANTADARVRIISYPDLTLFYTEKWVISYPDLTLFKRSGYDIRVFSFNKSSIHRFVRPPLLV